MATPVVVPALFMLLLFQKLDLVLAIDRAEGFEKLPLGSAAVGPESLAFDRNGEGPYTGVYDGRILKWRGPELGWTVFAWPKQRAPNTVCDGSTNPQMEEMCGRPLGLQFHRATGELYIADAYFGLLVVGPNGGPATQLANEAEGVPFRFTNGLDIDQETGVVYFTDSSTRFQRRDWILIVLFGDATGRLMKYDPTTKTTTVLKSGLTFPNGVAVSKDNSFLVLCETSTRRTLRYWIRGPQAGALEDFAKLPGNPDNVKRNSEGDFWVAVNQLEAQLIQSPVRARVGSVAVRLGADGEMVDAVDCRMMSSISEAEERNGSLWLGSIDKPYVGLLRFF